MLRKISARIVEKSGNRLPSIPTISIIDKLILEVEKFINSKFSNRLRTLPVKIAKRNQNTTVTWNIFPTKTVDLDVIFSVIAEKINSSFTSIKGEIIKLEDSKGNIIDSGIQEFKIIKANTWEIYLYDPEVFLFIRLLYELRLENPDDKWLSIDIDITENSAWFAD